MIQDRLFRAAPEAVQVSLMASTRAEWAVRVSVRRSGETWELADVTTFELLTGAEALDALEGTLASILGVVDD